MQRSAAAIAARVSSPLTFNWPMKRVNLWTQIAKFVAAARVLSSRPQFASPFRASPSDVPSRRPFRFARGKRVERERNLETMGSGTGFDALQVIWRFSARVSRVRSQHETLGRLNRRVFLGSRIHVTRCDGRTERGMTRANNFVAANRTSDSSAHREARRESRLER